MEARKHGMQGASERAADAGGRFGAMGLLWDGAERTRRYQPLTGGEAEGDTFGGCAGQVAGGTGAGVDLGLESVHGRRGFQVRTLNAS